MADRGVAPWLGRFLEALPISAEGGFRLTAAIDGHSGKRCVVASAGPRAEPRAARAALERAYTAHAQIDHPVIAKAIELGEGSSYVVLDCPARLDLSGLLMMAREPFTKVRHGAADGFIVTLRDALLAAAEHPDPRDGGPSYLGTLGYANVLLGADGSFWLIGFGHNIALADEHGNIGGRSTAFQAPEVAVGARPTKSSDFIALLLFMRSLVPFVVLERSILRVLAGNTLAEDFELGAKLLWFERRMLSAIPQERATIAEAIQVSTRIRELLGVRPDVDAFRASLAQILVTDTRFGTMTESTVVRVADDGSYVERPGSSRAHVPGRGPLRKIVSALARARLERPGGGLTVAELFAAGWPGERASQRSARNRVHVAMSTLRRIALASDLESHAGAYRISPAAMIELARSERAHTS